MNKNGNRHAQKIPIAIYLRLYFLASLIPKIIK